MNSLKHSVDNLCMNMNSKFSYDTRNDSIEGIKLILENIMSGFFYRLFYLNQIYIVMKMESTADVIRFSRNFP